MARFFRKKPTSVIRTQANSPQASLNWTYYVKPVVFLVVFFALSLVYMNWSSWLAALDRGPIKAYALTHKTQFTTNADIRELLAKEPALKGYFGQDIQGIQSRFLDIPWVRDAVVRKVYPDRLSLTLIEHRPAAIWNEQHLVSDRGVVFNLPEGRFDSAGLPRLYGPDLEAKNVLAAWYKIKKDLESRNLVLKSVATDIRGAWAIILDNGIELKLGRGDWLPKIDRFVTIFPHIEIPQGKRLAYVDLRYEHGVSVGFHSQ